MEDAFSGAALRKITVEGACKQDGTPSPEAPVPIEVIENPVLKVIGRNFWDKGVVVYNYSIDYLKYNADASVTLPAGTYTISSNGKLPNLQFFEPGSHKQLTCAEATDMDGVNIRYSIAWNGYSIAPVSDNARVLTMTLTRAVEMTGCVVNNQGTWIQVEYGTEATAYAPHVGTSQAFTLPAKHPYLAKLPDGTADTIEVDKEGNVSLVARVQNVDVSNLPAPSRITPLANGMARYEYWSFIDTPTKNDTSAFAPAFASVVNYMFPTQGMYVSENSILVGATAEPTETLKAGGYIYTTLATPVTYQLGKIEMPKAQDSIVNAWTDAEVTPRTGIEYTRDVNIVIANLESAIASITEG